MDVDLDYPNKLHDLHKDYPLGPEIISVSDITKKNNKEAKDEDIKKLTLKVMDKKKYVLHFSALKFYLQHGPKLKQIHRIVSLQISTLKKIDFNNEKKTDDSLHDNLTISWHNNQPGSSAITHPYI